ncbi:hypothetical protein ACIRD6_37945 [Streptomyces sp. NPDC102473]
MSMISLLIFTLLNGHGLPLVLVLPLAPPGGPRHSYGAVLP